jgi:hypothetical protein
VDERVGRIRGERRWRGRDSEKERIKKRGKIETYLLLFSSFRLSFSVLEILALLCTCFVSNLFLFFCH